ncbi:MAG: hypothetical protein IT425_05995 [Pirellulales bacterium]|nr:hypothetical protein [Pirellulales bacterium]
MSLQLECPGCRATLNVPDELAGKQGKCVHCGQRLTVPGRAIAASAGPPSGGLFESPPEAMVRELFRRQQSALLLVFPQPGDGSYDVSNMPETELKCIATEDINQARFQQLVASFAQRFVPRKKGQAGSTTEELYYELKGDRLSMTLEEFKRKYERSGEGGVRLPLCSDTAWGANKASLRCEAWHQQANIIHARVDLPSEDNSPTVAGVKTELLLYQFIDGKLFRMIALFPTDKFHLVSEAAIQKFGPVTHESQKPRQLAWENSAAWVTLTRGSVHPPEPSVLELVHRQLQHLAESRMPTSAADI